MKSKQILDVQQMQHLQELGLKLKQSLVHYYRLRKVENAEWHLVHTDVDISSDNEKYEYIPAYTLQDVLDTLPSTVLHDKHIYELDINMCNETMEYVRTSVNDVLVGLRFTQLPLIDSAYSLLCWAIENKFVETDKNE